MSKKLERKYYNIPKFPLNVQIGVANHAERYLKESRFNWDLPHTIAVVDYAIQLGQAIGVDLQVAYTAAWFHDTGYYGLFKDGKESADWDKIADKKAEHMRRSAQYAQYFFDYSHKFSREFSEEQRQKVVHLVSVHDNIEKLTSSDEILLGQADTLGMIDVTKVTPTFDAQGFLKFLDSGLSRRSTLFKTAEEVTRFKEVVAVFVDHFRSLYPELREVENPYA